MADKHEWGMDTAALHGGFDVMDLAPIRSFMPPVIMTAAYALNSIDQYTRIIKGEEPGYSYTRVANPTVDALEKRLAIMEGGEDAIATPSGMMATYAVTTHLVPAGQEVVTTHRIFGEAFNMFFRRLPVWAGITAKVVENPSDLNEWESKITPKTRMVWMETPSNPTLYITDIAGLAKVAHAHGIPLAVDSTLATPCLLRPLALGADIVVHSLTKYISGGNVLGGAVVGSKEFIADLTRNTVRCIGSTLPPFEAYIALLSLETLPMRMAKHCSNAEKVAAFLAQHPKIKGVNYPSLPNHPQRELAQQQMPDGFGGLLSFEVQGGKKGAIQLMEAFKMIRIMTTFAMPRTVATHPRTHTHKEMKQEEAEAVGIFDGLIRLSVGIECPEDIIADLDQALDKV